MNKKVSSKILRYAKKIKCINLLGGKCNKCGDDNIFHLVFHHTDSNYKEKNINSLINNSYSLINKELKKCILLCSNCHNELHFNEEVNSKDTEQRKYNKNLFVNYKGCECKKCHYNKNITSLVFHHNSPNNKTMIFGGFREKIKTIEDLEIKIKKELDDCDLLCQNCHTEKHFDVKFFNEYYNEIIEKSINYKEKRHKLPIVDIIKMYTEGKSQTEIAKFFNASKGTISGIIKNNTTNKREKRELPIDDIIKMYGDGKKQIEISKIYNIPKSTLSILINKFK